MMHANASTMTTASAVRAKTSSPTMRRKHARAVTTTTRAVKTASPTTLKKGVVTGKDMLDVLDHARENGYAIPAVNCTMSPVINACLEAAKEANAPMIVQFSNGGGYFMAGKGTSNEDQKAAVAGCVAGASSDRCHAVGAIDLNPRKASCTATASSRARAANE